MSEKKVKAIRQELRRFLVDAEGKPQAMAARVWRRLLKAYRRTPRFERRAFLYDDLLDHVNLEARRAFAARWRQMTDEDREKWLARMGR